MWNTEGKAKVKRQKAKVRTRPTRRGNRRLLFTFYLLPFAFCLSGCRMDMQDQPRYEAFERGDTKTFPDGQSSRQLVEGTVPRMPAGQPYVDRQSEYFYTGRMSGTQQQQGGAPPTGVG